MKDKTEKVFNLLTEIAGVVEPIGRIRLVAAIVNSRSEIQSLGAASRKTHPLQKKFQRNNHSICLHAEIDAIRKALQKDVDLSECVLYICRIRHWDISKKRKVMGWGNSCPCSGCRRAIEAFKIRKVLFTLDSINLKWSEL